MAIKAVFFDVGETLIDESRMRRGWAAYLGVPAQEFRAALEQVIAGGEHHRRVFDRFRPHFDIAAARPYGDNDMFTAQDLYPDAAPCLRELRAHGYRIGIAGNQPAGAVSALQSLDLAADFIASSTSLGVEKPSTEFFAKLAVMAGLEASEIAYVGDRLDNDILPARTAGMLTAFLERGPWAKFQAGKPEAGPGAHPVARFDRPSGGACLLRARMVMVHHAGAAVDERPKRPDPIYSVIKDRRKQAIRGPIRT